MSQYTEALNALSQHFAPLVARAAVATGNMEANGDTVMANATLSTPTTGPDAPNADTANVQAVVAAVAGAGAGSSSAPPQLPHPIAPAMQAPALAAVPQSVFLNTNPSLYPPIHNGALPATCWHPHGVQAHMLAPAPYVVAHAPPHAPVVPQSPQSATAGVFAHAVPPASLAPAPTPSAPADLAGMMQQFLQGLVTMTTAAQVRPNVQFQVPPVAIWDGKSVGRRAQTFLRDVERLATMTSQAVVPLLFAHLGADFGEHVEQVRQQHVAAGREFTWELAQQAFLALTGEVYERTAEQMRLSFVQGSIKQSTSQSLAQYRAYFDTCVRTAGTISPEMAAAFFVAGLKPDLRSRCQGDAMGRVFVSVDAAYTYALKEERKLAQDKPVKAAPLADAAPMQAARPPFKRGRDDGGPSNARGGGGGGKRGGGGGGRYTHTTSHTDHADTRDHRQDNTGRGGRGGRGRGGGRGGGGSGGRGGGGGA